VIYGENVSWEYGGVLDHDKKPYSAMKMIENNVAEPVDAEFWHDHGISDNKLNLMRFPSVDEIEASQLEPIFLSYFQPWDGYENYHITKKYVLRDISNEWNRDGYIDEYDQIDSIGYLINYFIKYVKLGFGRTTDVVGYWRRSDHIDLSLAEGRELIEHEDHRLDQAVLDDFLEFTGYSDREFWDIVDTHRNERIFDESFADGPLPMISRILTE
jgi:hypothetical protein